MASTEVVVTVAECRCCRMWEECSSEYIRFVQARFCGVWVCGLCAEAVKDEQARLGLEIEAALRAHAEFREITVDDPSTNIARSLLHLLKKMISTSTASLKS